MENKKNAYIAVSLAMSLLREGLYEILQKKKRMGLGRQSK